MAKRLLPSGTDEGLLVLLVLLELLALLFSKAAGVKSIQMFQAGDAVLLDHSTIREVDLHSVSAVGFPFDLSYSFGFSDLEQRQTVVDRQMYPLVICGSA